MLQTKRLHQLPIPTPFNVGPVNVYLLEGDPLTLIDCGPRTDEAYDGLVASLGNLGYQIADLEQVIITHHHTDHIGLAQRVIQESGAKLVAHQFTVPYLENPKATRERDQDFLVGICQEGGVPETIIQLVDKVTAWVDKFGTHAVTVDHILNEGDLIQAGDTLWQVYYTPGHAGDLICLFDPQTATLLASDHLILKISSNPLVEPPPVEGKPRPRRLLEYIEHMQRMVRLNPHIAYSGHGEPIKDIATLVEQRVTFHHQRADKILEHFNGQPANLWDMTEKMFSHIHDTEKFLAISEVLGHVDLLERDGKLERTYQNDVLYWQPIT